MTMNVNRKVIGSERTTIDRGPHLGQEQEEHDDDQQAALRRASMTVSMQASISSVRS